MKLCIGLLKVTSTVTAYLNKVCNNEMLEVAARILNIFVFLVIVSYSFGITT
uniref:Uncharacterized protein n=1 Tax=Arundo donax TaxID=35708 RepID=A0A0A9DV66_ARUDO